MGEVKEIIRKTKEYIRIERRGSIFEKGRKLSSDDLKIPQDPEEFTKGYIIEKVFQILGINYETGERRFITPGGIRKADYGANNGKINFLVEVKPLNENL